MSYQPAPIRNKGLGFGDSLVLATAIVLIVLLIAYYDEISRVSKDKSNIPKQTEEYLPLKKRPSLA